MDNINMIDDNEVFKDPFGNPDASRSRSVEGLEKVGSTGFVKISITKEGGVSNNGSEKFRVIVGKKGSGKTLYLRRSFIKIIDNKEKEIYSENFNYVIEYLDQSRPQTELILKFSQLFNGEFLTEKWRELWRRAILRTILTHILYAKELKQVKLLLPSNFSKKFGKILSKAKSPITIFSQVVEIISSTSSNTSFNSFCNNILWAELDGILGPIINESIPLYFYIDAIDEEYQHAPMYWMRAQKGLFYSVMQFLRDRQYGGKLHIIISVRDHVYSNVLQSEHETRYLDNAHVSILKWDSRSALYLLKEKLKYLNENLFILKGEKTIENWVGLKYINNSIRSIDEEITDYLVRHTRAIPRDIIVLSNAISNRISKLKLNKFDFKNFEEELKKIIHDKAKIFAEEQLQITSNHLTSNMMPSQAVELGIDKMYTTGYTGDQEYFNLSNIYRDKICKIIKYIDKDRFTEDEINDAKIFAKTVFEIDSDLNLFDILWQNTLVGYSEDNVYSTFFDEISTDFKLPLNKPLYVFHTILIDKLDIKPIGLPVKIKYSI